MVELLGHGMGAGASMKKLTLCSPVIWANTWAPCLKQVGDDGDDDDDDDDDYYLGQHVVP